MNFSISRTLSAGANTLALACAVVVAYAVAKKFVFGASPPPQRQPPAQLVEQKNWQALFTGGQRSGTTSAAVGMVVFSDYECPACLALHEQLRGYEKDGLLPFAVLYRHWPLQNHRYSEKAAIAVECAAKQDRFRSMHDALFANQAKLGVIPWTDLAVNARVPNMPAFELCLDDQKVAALVKADAEVAISLKSQGTPTVILAGGTRFVGVPAKQRLDSLVSAVAAAVASGSRAR